MNNSNGSGVFFNDRDKGIDMLRALTVLVMIFVNSFWKVDSVPHWLQHAEWGEDFMGLADLVFPCFLFAVGMSVPFAIERRRSKGKSDASTLLHILERTFALLVMGAFLGNSERWISDEAPYPMGIYWILMFIGFVGVWNCYPRPKTSRGKYVSIAMKVTGAAILIYLMLTFRNSDGGVFGFNTSILGLIAWSYLICSVVYLIAGPDMKAIAAVMSVFVLINIFTSALNEAYGARPILYFPDGNFLGSFLWNIHVGNGGLCACTMGGIMLSVCSRRFGRCSEEKKLLVTGCVAAVLFVCGCIARHFFIISKIAATLPWVCFSMSAAVFFYALFSWMVSRRLTGWFCVISAAGTSTLTAYIVPYLLYGIDNVWGVNIDFFREGIAGLGNCALFSLVCIWITALLEKLRIKLKI